MPLNRLLPLLLLLLAACPATTPADDDDDDSAADDDDSTPYVQPGPFEDMEREERIEFMRHVVVPTMQPLLAQIDPEKYNEVDFGCDDCHGEDYIDADYEMPNGIVELSVSNFPHSQNADPELREYGELMEDEFLPTMAGLLGRELWTQQTPDGMSCSACHPIVN